MTNTKSIKQDSPAVISPAFLHVLDLVDRIVVDTFGGHHTGQSRGQVRYSVNASERVRVCTSTSGELECVDTTGTIRYITEPGEEFPREVVV